MSEPREPQSRTEVHRVAEPGATRVAGYLAEPGEVGRVLLLYSGGLDTSVMLKWIQDVYGAEVVALTVNLGQPGEDYGVVEGKARQLGAVEPRGERGGGLAQLAVAELAVADRDGGLAVELVHPGQQLLTHEDGG